MDNTEFKKELQKIVNDYGFIYCKKKYYYDLEKMTVLINLQKSNYENSYYVNYGFCIKDLHDGVEYPKINECDLTGRFFYEVNGEKDFKYPLDIISNDELKTNLEYNINSIIIPVINEGVNKYFELFPEAIYVATLKLKKYLGMA
ncbi:DUF4304 domain-containing protein [Butyrivibrio sp. XB500-5]|uniref:DUF4304 domain-containing protein n=1 Tax=Butyrivibrio sp. XB500-5 TaxID=2364880 RepID=UPI001313D907|nr:DUF4304 domain-containing protein [Butyrivibrio sp. XB500-5]